MKDQNKIILTNMCMVYDEKGRFLVQDRLRKDWPGINFPGGHILFDESIANSCAREMREETGLEVKHLEWCGFYEWNVVKQKTRHLAILFRTNCYSGDIIDSKEGKIFWISEAELKDHPLSVDFEQVLAVMKKGL